jgi:hypothetical protein
MRDQLFVEGTVKDGKLHFPIKAFQIKYDNFFKEHKDGVRVEIFIGVQDGKGSNPQLARVHAMIREIANELGYTFEEVKLQVKRKAGLCFMKNNKEYCKSFAKCDKEELNLAIQAALEIGDFSGMQLR